LINLSAQLEALDAMQQFLSALFNSNYLKLKRMVNTGTCGCESLETFKSFGIAAKSHPVALRILLVNIFLPGI
jgi:hypothetical protein